MDSAPARDIWSFFRGHGLFITLPPPFHWGAVRYRHRTSAATLFFFWEMDICVPTPPQKKHCTCFPKNSRRSLCNSFLQHATFCGCISVRSLSVRQNDAKQIPTHLLLQVCSFAGNNRVMHYIFLLLSCIQYSSLLQ